LWCELALSGEGKSWVGLDWILGIGKVDIRGNWREGTGNGKKVAYRCGVWGFALIVDTIFKARRESRYINEIFLRP